MFARRRFFLPWLARTAVLLVMMMLPALDAGAQNRIIVVTEPGTPVIATEILVLAGPANEPESRAGVAYLAARAVTQPVIPVLDSLGAHLAMDVHKDAVSVTLVAAPDAWEEASRIVMVALFRDPPTGEAVQRERAAILRELMGRQANPADAVTRAADRAFFGEDHPWARPAVGTLQSLSRITTGDVDDFLREHVRSDRALAVVVGPIEEQRAREHLSAFISGYGHLSVAAPPGNPESTPTRIDYNSITTWISASYPYRADADEEALRLAAHLVLRLLDSGEERHLVYNSNAEFLPRAGGGEIRFQLVTPPSAADRLADRLQTIVRQLASTGMHDDVWDNYLRRYRGERLQTLASPDARAYELARRLIATSGDRWLLPDFNDLSQDRMRSAMNDLGAPTIVFLGPNIE